MSAQRWSDAAWAAWRRHDTAAAIAAALARADDHGADAVRLAAYFGARVQRPDLLLSHRTQVEDLPDGFVRDVTLALFALTSADRRRAVAIAMGLRHAEPDVASVAEDDTEAALGADLLLSLATASVASGAWVDGQDCAAEARYWLSRMQEHDAHPRHPSASPARIAFGLLGVEALTEYHTHGGDDALRALEEALAPVRRQNRLTSDHALGLVLLGGIQHLRGDLPGAAVTLTRGIALAMGDRPGLAEHTRIELAFLRVRQGRWEDADRLAGSGAVAPEPIEAAWFPAQVAALGALMATLRGDTARADRLLALTDEHTESVPSYLATMVATHARLVRAITHRDWVTLTRILEDVDDPGYRHPYREDEWHAVQLAAHWYHDRVTQVREQSRARAARPGADVDAYHWVFTALLADHDGDAASAAAAAARAAALLGPDLDPVGERLAREYLAPFLPDAGIDPDPGTSGPGGAPARTATPSPDPAALTTQQRRIATAVAQGYTSAEIAAMMHLTKRTIDYHVQNIVRRLGVTSRREIARRLRELSRPDSA